MNSLQDRYSSEKLEIVILSNNPEKTQEYHGVSAVDRWHPLALIRTLRKSDVLISGGGGLLQDNTSTFSLWYYLGIIYLARLLSVPIYVLGQGIGPINKSYNETLLNYTLKDVKGFLVRDDRSFEILKSLGVNEERVIVGDDLAFSLPRKKRNPDDFLPSPDKDIVAAALRNDIRGRSDVLRAVSSGLDMLQEKFGVSIVLFSSNSSSDREMNNDIESATDANCNIIDVDHLSPVQLVEMMRGLDLVIAGRLHTLIFSFISGTPVQGISYDPKMDYLIEDVNELKSESDFSLWHPEDLINATEYLSDLETTYKQKGELRETTTVVRRKMKERATRKLNEALEWLDRELKNDS